MKGLIWIFTVWFHKSYPQVASNLEKEECLIFVQWSGLLLHLLEDHKVFSQYACKNTNTLY